MVAIDAGAEDVLQDDNVWEIVTAPGDLQAVRQALESAGVEIQNAELTMRPSTTIDVDEAGAGKVLRLIEALDDQDDVNAVHANFEADADVLERAAAAA
jgi:transcriptional/translational regulatory protein YebC/TACO1